MPTNTKTLSIAEWMAVNNLTAYSFASAIHYSPGAVSKWRQKLSLPEDRALKTIRRVGLRRGWSPFPGTTA